MGRPSDPLTPYRIKPHVVGEHIYASTQPTFDDPETGKKVSRRIHWGKVVDGVRFVPGNKFFLSTPEERAKLVFPDDWDLSEAETFTGLRQPGRPVCDYQCQNRNYGHIWLLEQVAMKTGIRQDLTTVFNGNSELVDDVLTLAMYPYLTDWTFNRLARWQDDVKAPSSRSLTPSIITRLTQSITERHRMELLKLRAARLKKDELCAVDSTTRSAYGTCLADIKAGKNKEDFPLEQTLEVVVYSLASHAPIYYRTFPGNIPDSRALDVILADLDHAGFKDLVLVTDRGYDTVRNLEKHILRGQRMITRVKAGQGESLKMIESLGEIAGRPKGMGIDKDAGHYYKEFALDCNVKGTGTSVKPPNRLKLHLYFDSALRAHHLFQIDLEVDQQSQALQELLESGAPLEDIASVKRENRFHKITCDASGKLKSYELDTRKVARSEKFAGFFSIMTNRLDFDSKKTFESYRLRDEQEKCFQQMKGRMCSDRRRNWPEAGKTGRLFILPASLILGSHARHAWSSGASMREPFDSSLAMVDRMRAIRRIERSRRVRRITAFVGKQIGICEAFGFTVPKRRAPVYGTRRKPNAKRGRPQKKTQLSFQ
jgi:hypothetical protein